MNPIHLLLLLALFGCESCGKETHIEPNVIPSTNRTIIIETRTAQSNWTEIFINDEKHIKTDYGNTSSIKSDEPEFITIYNGKVGDTLNIIIRDMSYMSVPYPEVIITDTLYNLLDHAIAVPDICHYPLPILNHTYIIK
jgi:hypothetical protein